MLVGTPVGFRHEHAILSQHCQLLITFSNGLFVFAIAGPCFDRGSTPRGNTDDLERIRQSFTDQVDTVAALDLIARCRAFTIQLHMSAGYGRRCTAAGLEEAAVEQPAIDAQRVCQLD